MAEINPNETRPIFLTNYLRNPDFSPPAYESGPAPVAGFEIDYIYDSVLWQAFRVETGTTSKYRTTYSGAGPLDVDSLAVIINQNPLQNGGGIFTVYLRVIDGGSNPLIASIDILESDRSLTRCEVISSATTITNGTVLELEFRNLGTTNDIDVLQLSFGKALQAPRGQHVGLPYTTFQGNFSRTNTRSVNGAVIGGLIRNQITETTLEFDWLDRSFVRNEWAKFINLIKDESFFYVQNPDELPNEVTFATPTSFPQPEINDPKFSKVMLPCSHEFSYNYDNI